MARLASALVASVLSLAACADHDHPVGGATASPGDAASAVTSRRALDVVLPWGAGDRAIGWRAPAAEFRGDGPSGIAIAPTGSVVVLDRLQGRAIAIDDDGIAPLFAVAEDAELLALDADGSAVVASAFRARAWIHDRDGGLVGEIALPRLAGEIARVALVPSRQIEITTALQDRFLVGGPATTRDDAAVLRSKREGSIAATATAPALAAIRTADGRLGVFTVGTGDRRSATTAWADLGDGDAVRLVGRTDHHVVAVTEHVEQPGEALVVRRELVVLDGKTGEVLATQPLPRAMWVPREWIAIAPGAALVAHMTPTAEGLRVARIDLDALVARGGVK